MKTILKIQYIFTFIILIISTNACSNDSEDEFIGDKIEENITILQEDADALLFMLEEEKLARDTYSILYEKWGLNQFANIKKSEQTHMDAIENLLKQNEISYTILPEGVFNNKELQAHYDTFKEDGAKSVINALKIGATIEDLDIKDLENYVSLTKNNTLINVYQNLICGSRNHLRSFMKGLEKNGGTYTPQFITQDAFDAILNSSQEQCN
ncbi:DUF2202 domain-containing protein [Polaribacter septentrionalilitoris]|uniref:DUF2202 domain-containing protein n=1 Tax=Polaribacter septentrionalilitoris TaxID=2494657 RepID=UPI00135B37E5|nr:DUF2202 domain-containing protein [Polaribacter septentrionalilitoris]